MRCFRLVEGRYVEATLDSEKPRFWLEELQIGLGIWHGQYKWATRSWLRWYGADGKWILTEAKEERRLRLELIERLKQKGIDIDAL